MTQHPAHVCDSGLATALAERCGMLRLACWYQEVDSDTLIPPAMPTDRAADVNGSAVATWMRYEPLSDAVRQHALNWLSDTKAEPKPIEHKPGCWLVPTFTYRGRRVSGVMVGVTFAASVTEQAWFKAHCDGASVSVEAARLALSAYTWPGEVDLALLDSVFAKVVADGAEALAQMDAIDMFSEQLMDTYEQTNLLFVLSRLMNRIDDPAELIPTCCEQIMPVLPFNWIVTKFWEREQRVHGLTGTFSVSGRLPCDAERFEAMLSDQFADRHEGEWKRLQLPDDGGVAELVGSEVIAEPIMHDGRTVGVLLAGNKRGNNPMQSDVTSGELQFIEAASNMMGVFHENILRFDDQRRSFMGTLRALTAAIDAKDPYTRGHSERVAYLAAQLAEVMGLPPEEVERVHTTGLVHDVGKIGVPEKVLCKSGRLTSEEFDQIKRHPQIGYDILGAVPSIDPMLPGVLHHHERWDGRGYPHGLAGEDIPLLGRILALADTFDAMSSTRSYRPAMPREKVLAEIRECTGTQFDPALAPLFVELDFAEYDRMVERHRSLSDFAA